MHFYIRKYFQILGSPISRTKLAQEGKLPLSRMGKSRQSQGSLNNISASSCWSSHLSEGLFWRVNIVRVTLKYLVMCKWLGLGTNWSEQMLVINCQQVLPMRASWMPIRKLSTIKMSSYLTHTSCLINVHPPSCSPLPLEQYPVGTNKETNKANPRRHIPK